MSETLRVAGGDFNDIPTTGNDDKPRHSWVPLNIVQLDKTPPEPPTIGQLLYPGKRTLISGETESLKTWLALILAKAEMDIERPVAWVDLDDMGAGAILQRLRTLGVADKTISDFFLYYQPEQRLHGDVLQDVLLQLAITGTRLMVIDAFNPMLSMHGLDMNSTADIETFWREVADPIAKTGTCPCLLDHVPKSAESRGKYSIGSERKASGATVHIGAVGIETLTVGGTGRSLLHRHKDRPGYLPTPTIGRLVIDDTSDTMTYRLEPDKAHVGGAMRYTILMERISRVLENEAEPQSQNWTLGNVNGNKDALPKALKTLHDEGYLARSEGKRGAHMYLSLKPYRETDDDTPTTDPTTDPKPTPSLRSSETSRTDPYPSRGGSVGGSMTTGDSERPLTDPNGKQNGHVDELPAELADWRTFHADEEAEPPSLTPPDDWNLDA